MPALSGTDRDPYAKTKPLEEKKPEKKPDYTTEELSWIEGKLKEHENFRKSPVGRTCLALAENEMRDILVISALPVSEFMARMGLGPGSHSLVAESRAELRGAYSVWARILGQPEQLIKRQAELNRKTS